MKTSTILALAASLSVSSAHTIFQKLSVNGVQKGLLEGVRAPTSNNPIENVNNADFACNFGLASPVSQQVVTVPAGAKVGTWWQHVLGQNQAGDSDNPIALSHKGPIQVYIAKVDNAATADGKTAKWTKIASDGLDTSTGLWAVDKLYSNNGWYEFTMPSCVAPGDYLMRAELLALHSAGGQNGAQFYQSCANIRVTGSGTTSLSGGVSFPGAYSPTDPGILISIYGSNGQPDNGRKAYTAPGPAVMTCPAGGNGGAAPVVTAAPKPSTTKAAVPTTMVTAVKPSTSKVTVPASTPVSPPAAGGASLYGQCGGKGFTGPKSCAVGACKYQNDWYSQCLPSGASLYAQCGGKGFTGEKKCAEGSCKVVNEYYSQCL